MQFPVEVMQLLASFKDDAFLARCPATCKALSKFCMGQIKYRDGLDVMDACMKIV